MPPANLPRIDPETLFDRLAGLRRRLRFVATVSGLAWLATILLAGPTLVGVFDSFTQSPPLVRAVALAGLLTAAGIVFVRRIVRPLGEPLDNLTLALKIEDAHPELHEALASTVEFLEGPPLGSSALRHDTVARALWDAEGISFREVIEGRGLRWAVAGLVAAVAVALPVGLVNPKRTAVALHRLADPFGAPDWPPLTTLELLTPTAVPARLARGEPFEVRARLTGELPARAVVLFALHADTEPTEVVVPVPPSENEAVITARLESGRALKDFRFRIQAHDADTGWLDVRVLPPPALVPLEGRPSPQVSLEFPAYTRLPPRELPDGGSVVEAVTGTTVRIRAATDRPIARAFLRFRPDTARPDLGLWLGAIGTPDAAMTAGLLAAADDASGSVAARLDRAGTVLDLTVVPRLSGLYALRFEDDTGLGATRLFDVRVQPDPPPQVTLERPSASQDSLTVLPDAEMPVQAVVSDPMFAVRSVALEYRTDRDTVPRQVPLHDSVTSAAVANELAARLAGPLRVPLPVTMRPTTVAVAHRFSLAAVRHADGSPLRDGDVVILHVVADDFDDVSFAKPVGRSHEIELRIGSRAAIETLLQKGQAAIRQELLKLQARQREATAKTSEVEAGFQKEGLLKPEDQERLLQAEQTQQQVRARVGTAREGLRAEVGRLRQTARDNKLPASSAHDRLDAVAAELERLAREELEQIEPLITAARKEGEMADPNAEGPKKPGAISEAVRKQKAVEQAIAALLDRLEPWSSAGEVRGEAKALLQEQERLLEQTDKLAGELPRGTTPEKLPAAQLAELERAAERQARLAERAERLLERMTRQAKDKEAQARGKLVEAEAADTEAAQKAKTGEPTAAREATERAEQAREAAELLKREANALREAAKQARAADPANPDPAPSGNLSAFAEAAANLRRNKLGEARQRQDAGAAALRQLAAALEERRDDDLDRLGKKLKAVEQRVADLTEQQERLQKKVEAAGQLADPVERQAELEKLARQQQRLRQEATELAQQLTRLRAEDAARRMSEAGRRMEESARSLERGEPAADKQDEALDRLDDVKADLSEKRDEVGEELEREKLVRLAEMVKALKERQAAALAETKRVHEVVIRDGHWRREMQSTLADLIRNQETLAGEIERLAEKKFEQAPVFDRIAGLAAEAMREAVRLLEERKEASFDQQIPGGLDADAEMEFDRTTRRQQQVALRRLEQTIEALKPDPESAKRPASSGGGDGNGGEGQAGRGRDTDSIPALAELKALRALQAEVNERTERFARERPDAEKWTDADRMELRAIRKIQAAVAELVQTLADGESEK